jgi:multidrug resistance efflux pump
MTSLSQKRRHCGVMLIVSLVFTMATARSLPAQSPSSATGQESTAGKKLAAEGGNVAEQDRAVVAEDKTVGARDKNAVEEESLEVRYARAHLELAKLDLERAKAWNKRVPNVFSQRTIDYLRKHVEIDEEQLKQAMRPDYSDVHEIYVRTAKAALDIAEADVARKAEGYKELRDPYTALELDRAVAFAHAARLNLERTLNQAGGLHSLSYLEWQVEELRNQILELHVKVEAASRQ